MGVCRYQSGKKERLRQCLRVFFTFIFSHVGLCALVVGYATVGAVIFPFLESEREVEQRKDMERSRLHYLWLIWNATDQSLLTFDGWSLAVRPLLKEFEDQVVNAAKMEGFDGKEVEDVERQWSFSGGLLYSFTVITTIGYGNLVPKTDVGKVFTMLYALIGIPLMLLFISNLGTLMATSFRFAFARICCGWSSKDCCHGNSPIKATSKTPSPLSKTFSFKSSTEVAVDDNLPKKETAVSFRDPHSLSIQDSDLMEHDYDFIDYVAPKSDCEQAKEKQADLSNDKWRRTMTRLYAMDRLNAEAKLVLGECEEYTLERPEGISAIRQKWRQATFQLLKGRANVEGNVTDGSTTSRGLSQDTSQLGVPKQRRPGEGRVPVFLVLAFLIGYICVGAVVFSIWEEWSYLDGAYFSFVTLSTIGFGDLVPGAKVLNAETRQLIGCILYLVLGLSVIAMSFNLVQEEVVSRFQKLGQNIGILDEK